MDDTIAAIITPQGVGGVGVLRISGDQSIRISETIIRNFPLKILPQKVYHGWVGTIDEALYYLMKAPNSYTGEDVIEISCHGGSVVLREVLGLIIKAGARLAEPGEFSKRAFLNGKIDLAQAEAIMDLVSAKSSKALEAAVCQLEGKLSLPIKEIRKNLISVLSEIEAGIDFPDDVDEVSRTDILSDSLEKIKRLLETADDGRILREGVRTTIIGRPNVGKSSLLNALLKEERAIVTEEPGTTRDVLEENIIIQGFPLVIIDTAGIRHPRDKAEEFGVERARRELKSADLRLLVIDASQELTTEDKMVLEEAKPYKCLVVMNKIDLGKKAILNEEEKGLKVVEVSALKGRGIEELKQEMLESILGKEALREEARPLINERHKECLLRAKEGLERALLSHGQELVAIDLKAAIIALGEVSGEEISEEVINTIFERFCVGK